MDALSLLQFCNAVSRRSFSSRLSPQVNGSGIKGTAQSASRLTGIETGGTGTYFVPVRTQLVSSRTRHMFSGTAVTLDQFANNHHSAFALCITDLIRIVGCLCNVAEEYCYPEEVIREHLC
ncbi:hypothetical protein SA5R_18660 [Pantoea dispersa]|uniref:Uncharacterized protein n=1 Tax=Pantoea dispersa TaxID=59814 RepID=A0A8E1S120_9GAMM|nr:hypothetical protein SA2_10865 [Pantoea dispersa]KTS22206.1 hypothetical protein SA4R_11115 [Pantoea dispersa]KTS57178.1 hypothetical protein SA5R_18660 [Pantoea dispersa]KTS68493.1 hypothetical protein SA3R_07270 [Pantoea dispersa]